MFAYQIGQSDCFWGDAHARRDSRSCQDAVRQKDGREIWWLSPSGRISDLAGRCLQATQSGELSLLRCQDAQASGANSVLPVSGPSIDL